MRTATIWQGMALRTNLLYDGTATPNLGIDFALGQHGSIGASIGLKPWPRWLAWDYDNAVPAKWRHRLVTLEGRWWPKRVYDGWFLGADALYLHYNFASLHLPFGLYPVLNNSRLQGDAVGAGLFAGYSWWLGEHWRLELAAGVGGRLQQRRPLRVRPLQRQGRHGAGRRHHPPARPEHRMGQQAPHGEAPAGPRRHRAHRGGSGAGGAEKCH